MAHTNDPSNAKESIGIFDVISEYLSGIQLKWDRIDHECTSKYFPAEW